MGISPTIHLDLKLEYAIGELQRTCGDLKVECAIGE